MTRRLSLVILAVAVFAAMMPPTALEALVLRLLGLL